MITSILLEELRKHHFLIEADGLNLPVDAPATALTEELLHHYAGEEQYASAFVYQGLSLKPP